MCCVLCRKSNDFGGAVVCGDGCVAEKRGGEEGGVEIFKKIIRAFLKKFVKANFEANAAKTKRKNTNTVDLREEEKNFLL